MKIYKILNNNVIVSRNEKAHEIIAMGRGIAFKKQIGDEIDDSSIDKIYRLNDNDANAKLQELLPSIPIEYMEIVDMVIGYAKTHLGKKLSEKIYISLMDHLFTSVQRFKEGIALPNALLWDIKRFYPDEFAIGCKGLDILEAKTGVRLPDDEAGFIALHIVNSEMDEKDVRRVYEITKVMQEISNIVRYFFNIEFDENSVYYYRFITHLKFFAQRLISGKTYNDDTEDELYEILKVKYHNSFACVQKIDRFLECNYQYTLSKEEQLYLTIHIERIVYKNR